MFILVTDNSCSASESIINGLRGVDVTVHLIGSTTCGKPFGFTAKDNCGISYFPIEAADDFSKPLGDPTEGMLATALSYRASGACPAPDLVQRLAQSTASGRLIRAPVRENKFR